MTGSNASPSPRVTFTSQNLPWLLLAILLLILLLSGTFTYWRSSSVGSQVQVPMFYDAHYLYPRPWTQEQSAPGVPDPAPVAIYGDNSVSQTFVAGSDNLSRIAFLLSGPDEGVVTAVLTDDTGAVRQAKIPLSSGEKRQEYSLSFPAIAKSKGQTFTLTLSAQQAAPEQPVIAHTIGGDRLGDSLRLNEFIRPGNLAVTTYSRGAPGLWWFDALGEQLLPSMFRLRLQQYKPAQFKGDLFSWLLIITVGLSATLLVLVSPGLQVGEKSFWKHLAKILGWSLVLFVGSLIVWQVGSGRAQLFTGSHDVTAELAAGDFGVPVGSKPRLMADLAGDLWTAVREPEARFVSTDIVQRYPAIRVPGDSRLTYSLTVPPGSRLRVAQAAEGSGVVNFAIKVNDVILFEEEESARENSSSGVLSWQELDLDPWAGQGVVLALETSSENDSARGLWFMPQIVTDASWILTHLPDEILPIQVRFGETAELLGVKLDNTSLQSEGKLKVKLLWRSLQENGSPGKVFVHLIDGRNQLVAQHDAVPVQGVYPFVVWPPGTIVQDEHVLQVDVDKLAAQPYRLEVGVYDPDSLQRWTAEYADGSSIESGAASLEIPPEVLP